MAEVFKKHLIWSENRKHFGELRFESSGIWSCVFLRAVLDVSKDRVAFPLFHMHLLCCTSGPQLWWGTIYKVKQSNKAESLTAILRNLASCSPNSTLSKPRTLESSTTPMWEPPVSLFGVIVEGYIVLRCDTLLIGNLLHFGGAGWFQLHGSATPSFVLALYDYRPTHCFPNIFVRGPFCLRKTTTDPHILAHVNNECPDDVQLVKFILVQATKAQRGCRGIALLGARWGEGGGGSTPRPGRFSHYKDPVPIV